MAAYTDKMIQAQEEQDIFRSKPTVGSVCGGICRALPFLSYSVKPATDCIVVQVTTYRLHSLISDV